MVEIKGCPVCWGKGAICVGLTKDLEPILKPCPGCNSTGWLGYKTEKPKIPMGEGRLIYVAGPYRAETEGKKQDNVRHATRVAVRLWELGWYAFSPINNTAYFDVYSTLPREVFLKGDLKFLECCQAIFMLRGWGSSEGAKAEFDLARKLGKEIYFE